MRLYRTFNFAILKKLFYGEILHETFPLSNPCSRLVKIEETFQAIFLMCSFVSSFCKNNNSRKKYRDIDSFYNNNVSPPAHLQFSSST